MAILLALFSALSYGVSDFVGGLVSRRAAAWPVAVVAQLSATVCTLVAAVLVSGDPSPRDFAWGVLAGVSTGVGTGFLYRGFASGRMSVVAPVSAVGSAVVPALAGAIGGERPSMLAWAGVAFALPGIWFVASTPEPALEKPPGRRGTFAEGLLDGILAGVGFGLLFAALGQVPDSAGLWPLGLAQVVSVPAVILLAVGFRRAWVPRGRTVWWALVAGPLGASATVAFLAATHRGFLTITGVLASLYPAITVLLAAVLLRERIHRLQAVGLGLCAVAIGLVVGG